MILVQDSRFRISYLFSKTFNKVFTSRVPNQSSEESGSVTVIVEYVMSPSFGHQSTSNE